MKKKILTILYSIIIGIACIIFIFSINRNDLGIIEFNNTALVEVKNTLLEPQISKGSLVLVNTQEKEVEKKDIIAYITLDGTIPSINTNEIVAITEDVNNEKIYSLTRKDGTIENIDNSCIIGTYKTKIPFMGSIIYFLLTTKGFLLVTVLPAVILLIITFIDFIKIAKDKK